DHPLNTVGGTYVFEDGVTPGTYYTLRATLVDHCVNPCTPSFDIRYAPGIDEAVWFLWRFKVDAGLPLTFTLKFDENDPRALIYTVPSDGFPRLDDMANIYFRMRQYVDWVKGHVTADTGATVRLYTFAAIDPVTGAALPPEGAYYAPHGAYIVLDVSQSEFE